ncbi:MAG TPA: RNA-binding protein [Halothiobacillaceae bacterium]|nr:RNA-binding protein [Halothiobacillaceae bacterium]
MSQLEVQTGADQTQRLDTWLWASRFFKTRKLAADAIDGGKIEHNGQPAKKRGKAVRPGDRLIISKKDQRFEVAVRGVCPQRGPAVVAEQMYSETEASIEARRLRAEQRRAERALHPQGKPARQARQLLRALRGKTG